MGLFLYDCSGGPSIPPPPAVSEHKREREEGLAGRREGFALSSVRLQQQNVQKRELTNEGGSQAIDVYVKYPS